MAHTRIRPRLNYTLLCDDVRQELGGKFSLMGLFENITTNSFPAIHHRFAIINEWTGGKGDFVVRVRLLAPDREHVLSESESRLSLFNETQRHRDISIVFNTTFKAAGTYWVEILVDGERAGMTPLTVRLVSGETVH